MKWSKQKEIIVQTGIIKLCAKIQNDGIEELKNRIEELEQKIKIGNFQNTPIRTKHKREKK